MMWTSYELCHKDLVVVTQLVTRPHHTHSHQMKGGWALSFHFAGGTNVESRTEIHEIQQIHMTQDTYELLKIDTANFK